MKKAFQVLKNRPRVSVVLTHDSVCAGDDCDAPHEKKTEVHSFVDPEALVREVASGYIPSVAGVGHSWICVLNDVKIAEITVDGIRTLVRETDFAENNRIHFIYKSARY